jgi:hypothetical protein
MSFHNLFYTLSALRVANLSSDSQPFSTTSGNYRNFVRQYAQEFGDRSLGEMPDPVIFGPVELLWKRSCLVLKKFEPRTYLW